MKVVIFLLCLVFLIVQQKTDAINCYVCDPGTDGCGPSFTKTGGGVIATTAITNATKCVKMVASTNKNFITRDYDNAGYFTQGPLTINGIAYNVYCCTSDLCNGVSMKKITSILVMITTLIALLLAK